MNVSTWVIRKIGTQEYWDSVCFGERLRAMEYRSITAALNAKCGSAITELVECRAEELPETAPRGQASKADPLGDVFYL